MQRFCGIVLSLLAAIVYALIISCGDDNPSGPGMPEDYAIYFDDGAHEGWFYEFRPLTMTLDSFFLAIRPRARFTVSANGKLLFVGTEDALSVVDLRSRSVINELPYIGATTVSRDNRFLAVMGNGLYILNLADYSVLYSDTISSGHGAFSRDGNHFYCARYNRETDSSSVFVVDVRRHKARSYPVPSGPFLNDVIPSADESRLFLTYQAGSCASIFMVYDFKHDSIIYADFLTPGNGRMLLTPDGKKVFYTNPGPQFDIGCPRAPSEIYVFDVATNTRGSISTLYLAPPPLDVYLPMGELAVTPDNVRLVTSHPGGFEFLLVLDINTMTFTECYNTGVLRQIFDLTCQSRR